METLISLLVAVAVIAVAIWLVKQIPWPEGLQIVGTILTVIIIVIGLLKVLSLL